MAEIFVGQPLRGSSANAASTNAGGALSVTFAASTRGEANYLAAVTWYASAPTTNTQLTVYDGTSSGPVIYATGSTVAAGLLQLQLPGPLRGSANAALTVRLSSAGAGNMFLNAYAFKDG